MVKKLYKHEFLAWLRVIVIVWVIALLTAGFNRVLQIFENDSVYYGILLGSSIFLYVVALLGCVWAPVIFGIVRFYRNFFTGEGYLTFTLPATKGQLLWVKISTAVCFSILSFLVCLLSGYIIMAGEVFTEVCKAAAYMFKDIPSDAVGHLIGWLLELLLVMLVSTFGTHMLYYTCICLGQTFRKNRVLAAVGVYFGFYMLTQIFSTVMGIMMASLSLSGVMESIGNFADAHPVASVHIALSCLVVFPALIVAAYWLICHWVLRKKLNLE